MTPQTAEPILLSTLKNKIPLVGLSSSWVKAGALYALDRDYVDIGLQSGELAGQTTEWSQREIASSRIPAQSGLRVEPENGELDQPGISSGADPGSGAGLSMRARRMKTNMRLRSILNLLTIGLVVLTVSIAGFVIHRESTARHQDLVNRGLTLAAMVAQGSEYAVYTENQDTLRRSIAGLNSTPEIAYVAIMNKTKQVLLEQAFAASVSVPTAAIGAYVVIRGATTRRSAHR